MSSIIDLDNLEVKGKQDPKGKRPLPTRHRWGVECNDGEGATIIPNWMLDQAVPTLRALGFNSRVAKSLWLVIIHLARYKYEKPGTRSEPAVGTIAGQLGIDARQCQRYFEKLEASGLLGREIRGQYNTTIYDYTPFSLAVRARFEEARGDTTGKQG